MDTRNRPCIELNLRFLFVLFLVYILRLSNVAGPLDAYSNYPYRDQVAQTGTKAASRPYHTNYSFGNPPTACTLNVDAGPAF